MSDFLFRGTLADVDADVHHLAEIETERQYRRLILIPSESSTPQAVREALSTTFHNLYAEGYPDEATRWMGEDAILDYETMLGEYRRYSDPRYYKGVEYADVVEALARRRAAELFAANGLSADDLFVNVQALSGGPANNAVYHALVKPGDTVMGMDLLHGGHLSHGSPVNRSGKYYNIVSYSVDPDTERIDYDAVQRLAEEHRPKMIITGFSSYPWQADFNRMRAIADSVGAVLMADIAHVAGLVAGGVYPSPIGIADVVTTTTHKTLCGPRGALIFTHKGLLARKIDRAVFPGEQGGPHVNVFAALAVALKLADSEQFKGLQKQIIANCVAFTKQFEKRGFRIPYGGTDTHLMNLDVKSIEDGDAYLNGDQAARLLDLAGIVTNRNTIPGDKSALHPTGLRMGTPWITQRGFDEKMAAALADIISDLFAATTPYRQKSSRRLNLRSKVTFEALNQARIKVRELAFKAGIDTEPGARGYPHFYYLDDQPAAKGNLAAYDIEGEKAAHFLNYALSSDVEALHEGDVQPTALHTPAGAINAALRKTGASAYRLSVAAKEANAAALWLRDLSDGFVKVDDDLQRKLPGVIVVRESAEKPDAIPEGDPASAAKPYYIGMPETKGDALPAFTWEGAEPDPPLKTALNQTHRDLGAKMVPFAGWDMPVWYSGVTEEHLAVRTAAGLFDVSHMGVYQAEGPHALAFLDSVCANDIGSLRVGESLYTHFLDPDANVIDDLLVYRRSVEKYLVVVNASNDDRNWAWLNAVRNGEVLIDRANPAARAFGRDVVLRNLRNTQAGDEMRVDIALQGPRARDILLAMGADDETTKRILKLKRTELCEAVVGGFDLVVSRTGYTGESMAFELFVHPEQSVALWNKLLEVGEAHGIKPAGLGARDSLRTEAGLPLYGHEMGGDLNLGVAEAGFRTYVKDYKPWFIGRAAFIAREAQRSMEVVRFTFNETGVRMAHLGDPVLDKRGRAIGTVTSCAIDQNGYLTGQAYIEAKSAAVGTPLFIFQSAPDQPGKALADLEVGDRAPIPGAAKVVSRFM
jgi:glycine hydroxymethyltransferase